MKKIIISIVIAFMAFSLFADKTEHSSIVGNNGEIIDITSTYDGDENLIYKKIFYTKSNVIEEYKYNSNGQKIYEKIKTSNGVCEEYSYEYEEGYSEGKKTYTEYKYNSKGNVIYYKETSSDGSWTETKDEYDSNGNLIYEKTIYSDGRWNEYKWNSKGNLIYEKKVDSNGNRIKK